MELIQAKKTTVKDASLRLAVALTVLGLTLPAQAARQDINYNDMFGDDYNAKQEINTVAATDTVGQIYDLLKVVLVVAGLFIFAGGIFQLIKAHKSQGQMSPATGWVMIFGGAVLSVAGAIFFALGGGIKGALVTTG